MGKRKFKSPELDERMQKLYDDMLEIDKYHCVFDEDLCIGFDHLEDMIEAEGKGEFWDREARICIILACEYNNIEKEEGSELPQTIKDNEVAFYFYEGYQYRNVAELSELFELPACGIMDHDELVAKFRKKQAELEKSGVFYSDIDSCIKVMEDKLTELGFDVNDFTICHDYRWNAHDFYFKHDKYGFFNNEDIESLLENPDQFIQEFLKGRADHYDYDIEMECWDLCKKYLSNPEELSKLVNNKLIELKLNPDDFYIKAIERDLYIENKDYFLHLDATLVLVDPYAFLIMVGMRKGTYLREIDPQLLKKLDQEIEELAEEVDEEEIDL